MNGAHETLETPTTPAAAPPRPQPAAVSGGVPPAPGLIQPQYAFDPRSKSPMLASFLSMMPGLGQVYVGYYRLAFLNILIFAGTIALIANTGETFLPLLPIFLAFFWFYNIIDAGRRAALYNFAMQGGAGVELPKGGLALPGAGGNLAAGLVLLVGGAILLLNTAFGYSLDWVEDWWPVAPIAFGIEFH